MKLSLSEFQDRLKETDVKFKVAVPIKELSYLRLGGKCALAAYPMSKDELIKTVLLASECGIKYKTIGRMSNILPPDGCFDGLLICTDNVCKIQLGEQVVIADCGATLPSIAAHLARRGFSSVEELGGIPGSVGGAVYMNAGAYGKEIADVLVSAIVLDAARRSVRTFSARELEFSYRHSRLSDGELTLVSASFAISRAEPRQIYEKMSHYSNLRRSTQPISLPSLGSVFKRHDGRSAAELIDSSGLKGFRIGGAAVSEKHAGFIVNAGGASSSDYKALVEYIKRAVFEKHGVRLCEEIEYLV